MRRVEQRERVKRRVPQRPRRPGWLAEELWQGETVFMLGGGPSLKDVNYDLIKDRKVIAVNNAYGDPILGEEPATGKHGQREVTYAPREWVDAVFFGDQRWYEWHHKSLMGFKGMIVTVRAPLHGRNRVLSLHRGASEGLETRREFLAWNKSSGGCAINLASHLGAKTIVLLGYDMRRVDDKANWHDDHPAPNKNPYERFLLPYNRVAKEAKKLNIEIINCTPGSAITHFPMMSLEEFIVREPMKECSNV